MKWFCLEWYEYLFKSESLLNLWCRLRGHPEGVVYYSSGFEPDMRCKTCGEDLG